MKIINSREDSQNNKSFSCPKKFSQNKKARIKKFCEAKNIIPLIIIFFVIFPKTKSSKKDNEIKLSLLNYDNYILATIQGKGEQSIFYKNENPDPEVFDTGDFTSFPDRITINGEAYTKTITYKITFPSEENEVKFEWDNPIASIRHIFRGAKNIIKLGLTKFNFENVLSMEGLCYDCISLKSVDLSNIDASKVTSMLFLFNNCKSLISVDFTNFITRDIQHMKGIFLNCEKIESIDLSSFDTPNLEFLTDAFNGCKSLEYVSINNLKTSKVTSMAYMFDNCKSLKSLDITNFNTEKLENTHRMFDQCSALISLDLNNFNTPSLINMNAMFYNCSKLEVLKIDNFKTTSVVDMGQVFDQCHSIKSLDLSHFYTPSAINIYHMFYNCHALEFLDVSNFNTDKIDNMIDLFYSCRSLKSLNLSNFNTSLVNSTQNMFFGCNNLEILDLSSFDTRNVKEMQCMFAYCYKLKYLDLKNFETPILEKMYQMFFQCTELTSLDITKMDTSKVVQMNHIFCGCKYLTSLDIRNFDTKNVNNMDNMFSNCQNLTSLDITQFNTEKVTNMKQMFDQCNKITSLNLKNFYTPLLENMYNMFFNCYSLEFLDITNLQTSKVTHMGTVFRNNAKLTSLNVSSFDTSQVTYMEGMFQDCKKLEKLDLSNFYTPNLRNCKTIFAYCESLTSLDISNFDVSKVQDISGMFAKCRKLTTLELGSFDTSQATNFNNLFDNCNSLTSLDITHFNTSKATSMGQMFDQCNALTSLDLSNFDTSLVTNIGNIFFACKALKYLDVSNFNTQKINSMNSIFSYTYNLLFLNLSSFDIYNTTTVNNMIFPTYNQIILCYNLSRVSDDFLYHVRNYKRGCLDICFMKGKKYIFALEICADDCQNQDIYKFEYDNVCYDKCPSKTELKIDSTYECENCRNYYNYEQTECIDSIPIRYYNNDTESKTIDKCPDKCKTCSLDSIKNNNNLCLTCDIDNNYYPKEDDINNINSYFECYNKDEVVTDYYLDTKENIFKSCYSLCNKCNEEGTKNNQHCTECKDTNIYELKSETGNCICKYYYNYEQTGCIDSIGEGYYNNDIEAKTIDKCPDKCKKCSFNSIITNNNLCELCNDDYYPKENDPRNRNSYIDCYHKDDEQEGYYLNIEESLFKQCHPKCKKCDGDGNNENNHCTECKSGYGFELVSGNCICGKYYNYEQTECIEEIPEGFYNNDETAKTLSRCPGKCKTCSLESIKDNKYLCISCNEIGRYYPKYNDPKNIDSFYECYQDPIGYYLDTRTKIFKPCYSLCKKCIGDGNNEHHNCLECIDDGNNYNLTDGNCINTDRLSYSYDVKSVSDGTRNDFTRTFIDMNEETISHLKSVFSLSEGTKIYVHISENDTSNLATADYVYEYILENGTKLELDDIEEDIYIDVYVPLKDLDSVNFELAKKYAELGYDIYNLHSKFYTDFCTPVNLNGNDVPLAERKKEIYPNNITFCKDNCVYKGINLEERRVICQCNLNNKTNDENLVQEDERFVTYFIDYINYRLFLCYKLFFNAYYIKHSYAFFIILTIIIIILIIDFIYICYSYDKLKAFMIKETPSYNKLYKGIYFEPKKTDMENIANPLKKELENNKEKKKKRKSKVIKNKAKSEKILLYGLFNDKYDSGNTPTDEPLKMENNNSKKLKSEKKRKTKHKDLQDIKEEIGDNEPKKEVTQEKEEEKGEKNEEVDLNELPYSKAIELDKRNIIHMYFSFLIEKLELINIFVSKSRLTIILFVEFMQSLLINFFLNALLYSDEIVSHKYHNNGKLDFAVSLVLSIISNIVTSLLCHYINYSRGIDERIDLLLEIKYDLNYFRNVNKFFLNLKIKFVCFFISQIIILATCIYYIEIFCVKYYCSQISLVLNYCYSFIESIITSFIFAFIILITRKIGLCCYNKEFYNTSKYINSKT